MLTLDHIAIGAADLETGVAWAEARLGLPLRPGGRHARFGTHNRLLGLGDIYIEVIAPDPDAAAPEGPRWFGLDRWEGPPRLCNWLCRTDDMDAARAALPADPGPALALSRGDLSWEITVPTDGSLPLDGACPTLLRWAPGALHPAARLPDDGCRLVSLTITHPNAARISAALPLDDPRVRFAAGPLSLSARIATPRGEVTL